MPTYEYRCLGCGRTMEVSQKITDEKLTVCEQCGGELQRLISGGTGFILGAGGGGGTAGGRERPACGRDAPCCGAAEPCGSSCRQH
ncbi:MAG: zinc ribbon domain-containing protein [Deltaproteobacteria bacterium]|nr:zinc ribbon domain-containing protein [Candidatus Anaeroferrophillacea bacterium]